MKKHFFYLSFILGICISSVAFANMSQNKSIGDTEIQNLVDQLSIDINYEKSNRAYGELIQMGVKAFPVLMKNIDNEKESHPEFGGARIGGPFTIGFVCFLIIGDQVEHFYWGYQPEYLKFDTIEEWWESHKDRSIRELQIEALKWQINEIQTNDMWREGKTWHLEQLWEKCKELNVLKECGLECGILSMKASLLNSDSGEVKVAFVNTGSGAIIVDLKQKDLFTGNVNRQKSDAIEYTVDYSMRESDKEYLTVLPSETQYVTIAPRAVDWYGKDISWEEIPQGAYNLIVYTNSYSQGHWNGFVYSKIQFKKSK